MKIKRTSVFKRNFKALLKKNFDITKFDKVLDVLLAQDKATLKQKYRDHALKGSMKGLRELHIESDWLLVYRKDNDCLELWLLARGSHDQVFRNTK